MTAVYRVQTVLHPLIPAKTGIQSVTTRTGYVPRQTPLAAFGLDVAVYIGPYPAP